MKRNLLRAVLIVIVTIFAQKLYSQNVSITTKIDGFRHNWDCGNDGVGWNDPDPRYRVWVGFNGGSFLNYTSGPGIYSGCSNTYGADAVPCSFWNPGVITGPTLSGAATTLNIDLESWEEDGCGSNCDANTCGLLGNDDDTRCGRTRIADIDFSVYVPCADHTYTGQFNTGSFLSMYNRCSDNNGAGYGINQLVVNWNFASAPTIITHPSDASYGGAVRDVCTGLPITLTVISNKFGTGNWTLGRWVKWQSSPDGSTWTDISGTLNVSAYSTQTTFTYNFTPTIAGTIYYRAVLSSLCSSGFASQTTNSNSVRFIVHDATTDPFCTAPQCNVAYVDPVAGNDVTGSGSPSAPYKTISKAATTAYPYIRVAKGSGTDAAVVIIPNNCIIEGGYVRTGTSGERWTKSSASADKTIITFSGTEAPTTSNRHVVAFKSDNKSGWTVKDIDIFTANTPASTFASDGRGMSNYGFLIINNSSNYNVVRCNVTTGNAGAGSDGTTPAGTGGANNAPTASANGGPSANGCGNPGAGGLGKNGNAGTGGPTGYGTDGAAGTQGAGGSDPGGSSSGCCSGLNGNNGGNAGNGGTGRAWNVADRPTAPTPPNAAYYTPAGQAESGGTGGSGGNGGGGSGARFGTCVCFNDNGSNGGNGSTGASGGLGGTGGWGAGGSFGIWINSSNTGKNIQELSITLGSAGTGGNGSSGQAGGTGANGASGGCDGSACGQCAGNGGKGGNGGTGGRGRDGANGTSAQLVTDGTASSPSAAISYVSTITLDNFSQRNNISGKMCNNSEIDMTKTSGTWVLPAGLSLVDDLTSSTSSYTTGSNSVKVTTNSAGSFYDISNGTVLSKFLYTATDNRTLPSIVKGSTYICKGSTMTLSTTNSFEPGNIQQYEWVIFDNGSNAASPYSGGSFSSTAANYTTPVFSTAGIYWVRYRERHNCCGWSRPVFTSFDVIDVPNAPAAISIVGGPYCYTGSGQSFTITIPGSSFAFPTYDSWELFDVDPSFGTPTAIQTSTSALPSFGVTPTQTTTYYVRGKNACGVSTALSVTANISGDQNSSGTLATATDSFTCTVNDALWHYFRRSNGEIICAINSNGQNLGNVKMKVTVETIPHDGSYLSPRHGNGGLGRNGDCLGQPELSMRRWYTITPTNQPSAGSPSTIRLFFTSSDYSNYTSEITSWMPYIAPAYTLCYGSTASAGDLAVSKNESTDMPVSSVSLSGGPNGSTQYELSVPSFSTFRWHTSGGIGEPLPVELVSFIGFNAGDRNQLDWVTAIESNTSKFVIEKSLDATVWNYLGEVSAAGNSTTPRSYQLYDNAPVYGNNYYRLKIVDLDGTSSFSRVINVPLNAVLANSIIGIYPNPTDHLLNIDLQSTDNASTEFKVYDIIGQLVMSKNVSLNKGITHTTLDCSNLAKGTYILIYKDVSGKIQKNNFLKK